MFKFNNKETRTLVSLYFNFEDISRLLLVVQLLTLSKEMFTGEELLK